MSASQEYVALDWIKGEICTTLQQAQHALEAVAETADDASSMRACLTSIHQIRGTLRMVGLEGPSQVAEEMEFLAHNLMNQSVGDVNDAQEVLMQAILQMPSYLDVVHREQADAPGVRIPIINRLRVARGEEPVLGEAAAGGDATASVFATPAADEVVAAYVAANGPAAAKKLRAHFQQSLLALLDRKNPKQNLSNMAKVFARVAKLTGTSPVGSLATVVVGVVEGVLAGAIKLDRPLGNALKQVDRPFKALVAGGADGLTAEVEEALVESLMAPVRNAAKTTPRMQAAIDVAAAKASAPAAAEPSVATSADDETIAAVVDILLQELKTITDKLDLYVRSAGRSPEELFALVPTLEQLVGTMTVVGMPEHQITLEAQITRITSLNEGGTEPSEEDFLEIAGALLEIEAKLAPLANERDEGSESEVFGDLDEARSAVIRETRNGLAQSKDAVIEFISSDWDRGKISGLPGELQVLRGGLTIVNQQRCADVLLACSRYAARELVNGSRQPELEEMDNFADAITSVDYFLERLLESTQDLYLQMIEVAENAISKLGYPVEMVLEHEANDSWDQAPAADKAPAADEAPAAGKAPAEGETSEPVEVALEEILDKTAVVAEPVVAPADDEEIDVEEPSLDDLPVEALTTSETKTDAVMISPPIVEPPAGEEPSADKEPSAKEEPSAGAITPVIDDTPIAAAAEEDNDLIDDEILEIFIEEATEVMETINEYFPPWRADSGNEDALAELRRGFHTLKGSGRMVGATVVGEMAWSIENMLNRVLDQTIAAAPPLMVLLDEVIERIPPGIKAFEDRNQHAVDYSDLAARAERISEGLPDTTPDEQATEPAIPDQAEVQEVLPEVEIEVDAFELDEVDADEFVIDEVIAAVPEVAEETSPDVGVEPDFELEVVLEDVPEAAVEDSTDAVVEELDDAAFSLDEGSLEIDEESAEEPIIEAFELDDVDADEFAIDDLTVSVPGVGVDETIEFDASDDGLAADDLTLTVDATEGVLKIDLADDFEMDELSLDDELSADDQASAEEQDIEGQVIDEDDGTDELVPIFREEAADLTVVISDFCRSPVLVSERLIAAFHTLKGSAAVAGIPSISRVAGPLEEASNLLYSTGQPPDQRFVALARQSVELVELILGNLGEYREDAPGIDAFTGQITALLADAVPSAPRFNFENIRLLPQVDQILHRWDGKLLPMLVDEVQAILNQAEATGMYEVSELATSLLGSFGEVDARPEDAIVTLMIQGHEALILLMDQIASSQSLVLNDNIIKDLDDLEMVEVALEDLDADVAGPSPLIPLIDELGNRIDSWRRGGTSPTGASDINRMLASIQEMAGNLELIATMQLTEAAIHLVGAFAAGDVAAASADADLLNVVRVALRAQVEELEAGLPLTVYDDLEGELNTRGQAHAAYEVEVVPEEVQEAEPEETRRPETEREGAVPATSPSTDVVDAGAARVALPGDDIDPDILPIFIEESEDLLESIDLAVQGWNDEPDSKDPLEMLLRHLHTLKGSARMAGLLSLSEYAHNVESFLIGLEANPQQIDDGFFTQLLEYQDEIIRRIEIFGRVRDGTASVDDLESMTSAPAIGGPAAAASSTPAEAVDLPEPTPEARPDASPKPSPETVGASVEMDMPAVTEEIAVEAASDRASDAAAAEPAGLDVALPADEVDEDILPIFLEETEELLEGIDLSIQAWCDAPNQTDAFDVLQRHLHTLKGGSRMAGLNSLGEFTHNVESVLIGLQTNPVPLDDAFFVRLHEYQDEITRRVEIYTRFVRGDASPEEVASMAAAPADVAGETSTGVSTTAPDAASEVMALPADAVDDDILPIFLEETEELLEGIDQSILDWTGSTETAEHLDNLLRQLHTLKGGSWMAGLNSLGQYTHIFETFLIGVQQKPPALDDVFFGLLNQRQGEISRRVGIYKKLAAGDATEDQLSSMTGADTTVTPPSAVPAASEVPAAAPKRDAPKRDAPKSDGRADAQEMVRVSSDLLEDLIGLAGESSITRGRVEQQISGFSDSLEEMEATINRVRDQVRRLEIEAESRETLIRSQTAQVDEFDELEMDRYTLLQEISRSLNEGTADMMDLKDTLANKSRDAETSLRQQARIGGELQEGLTRTRMVPFARLIPRLRRIVRKISAEVGKSVRFDAFNVEGELDRSVLDRIVAPLEHMLRNAVDHGIEESDKRIAAGKPETGRISLRLDREGAYVLLQISDDGGGIGVGRVREKAIERGLIKAEDNVPDHDVMQYIMHAGFSTAQKVTQISGRGVGMDVVSSGIKQLGGTVTIDSTLGVGTEFTIRLPFTVSVNRALMIEVRDDTYAVPLNSIEGIVRVSPYELEAYYQPDAPMFEYAGQPYKLAYMGRLLDNGDDPVFDGQIRPLPVLLVRSGGEAVALQVDHVLDSKEVVAKSLGPQFSEVRGVSGATILGDGSVVIILDVMALVRSSAGILEQAPVEVEDEHAPTPDTNHVKTVLIVDDSVTVRKVTSRLMERQGWEVETAKDGLDAVEQLQEIYPDVVLLDIEMPKMDGFEVLRTVRRDERLKDLPIIMITSRTGEKHMQQALDLGVNRYLGKPFQEASLLSTIEEVLAETSG